MAEYNSFTYDGITSSDFGVYIGGEKTFDAPALRGQSIEIPGRNGNVFISSDSYENVELVYPSFNFEPDLETFRSKLAKLRNALSSRASYKRLTDTLHPDEFRMAVFRDGFEAKPIKYNTAAEFDIVFDCKPQRFLKSGEIPVEYTPGQTPSDEQTKTGSIVTIEAEEGTIISDVKADINPVQDLHGYDKPWAGGTGKNKLPATVENIKASNTGITWNGNVGVRNGVTFTLETDSSGNLKDIKLNGTATSNIQFFIAKNFSLTGSYILSGGKSASISVAVAGKGESQGGDKSYTDDGTSRNSWLYVANGTVCNNITIQPMIRLASVTDATFEPYSNICPISGWDSVNVFDAGVNVWDEEWEVGAIDLNTGENLSGASSIRSKNYVRVIPNTTYCLTTGSGTFAVIAYDINKNYIRSLGGYTSGMTLTIPENCGYIRFYAYNGYGTTYNNDISINYPSTDTSYHAYNGQTYTIDLNGTRYGGTLDVTSGVLTVDRAMVDLGSLTYSRLGSTVFRFQATLTGSKGSGDNTRAGNIISDIYKTDSWSKITNVNGNTGISINAQGGIIAIQDNNYADASSFKTAMSGHQLCYELATPITVRLTPTEIKTLLGTNNIWADSGDITVKYGTNPYIIVNPTEFPSKPLLEVTGVGSFWLGDTQITITGTSGQIIYIDCETGECYKVTGGIISPANGLVTLNRLDFPKLASGINNIQLGSGISKVKVTPRWWRL